MHIKLKKLYSIGTKKTLEGKGKKCTFKTIEDIKEKDIVVLPDPLKEVNFLDKEWDISGDYCVFQVVKKEIHGLVLQPTENMTFRGDATPEQLKILVKDSENELLMVMGDNRKRNFLKKILARLM